MRGADLVVTAVAAARKAAQDMHRKLMAMRHRRLAQTVLTQSASAD